MAAPDEFPIQDLDGNPIQWALDGLCSGRNGSWTTTYCTADVTSFSATRLIVAAMSEFGLTLAPESFASVSRFECKDGPHKYSGGLKLYFERGRLSLMRPVSFDDTLDSPIGMLGQDGRPVRGILIAAETIPSGRGQRKAVKARAEELVALARDVLHLVRPNPVEVEYARTRAVRVSFLTRGGRGGWMPKVACSDFSLEEVASFAESQALRLKPQPHP